MRFFRALGRAIAVIFIIIVVAVILGVIYHVAHIH